MLDMDPSKLEAPAYHPIIKKGETDTYLDDLEDTIE
jgi:hypothetical protein